MKILVPGKTFLVGEYAVLLGSAALGLATKPCFEIDFGAKGFTPHPESPAGLYLKKHSLNLSCSLTDPGPGGFGRSTAEYLAAIAGRGPEKFRNILVEYKSLCNGSGIDLAFQYFGNLCLADPSIQFYQTFSWHFESLDFLIVSTGVKVSTHEHLATLDHKKLSGLPALANKITQVYAENKESEFLQLMTTWTEMLKGLGLTHQNSLELSSIITSFNEVKLVKPCGALGADVLLVFFERQNRNSVSQFLTDKKIKIQAGSADLCNGAEAQLQTFWSQNVG